MSVRLPREGPSLALVAWCLALLPFLWLTFRWFQDASLPWFSRNHPCRVAFPMIVPVAAISWLLLIIGWRDSRRRGGRGKDQEPPP